MNFKTIIPMLFIFMSFIPDTFAVDYNYYRKIFKEVLPVRVMLACYSEGPCLDKSIKFDTEIVDLDTFVAVVTIDPYSDQYTDFFKLGLRLKDNQGITKLAFQTNESNKKIEFVSMNGFFKFADKGKSNLSPFEYLIDFRKAKENQYESQVSHADRGWNGSDISGDGFRRNVFLTKDKDYTIINGHITFLSSSQILNDYVDINKNTCHSFIIKVAYRIKGERAGLIDYVKTLSPAKQENYFENLYTYDAMNVMYNLNDILIDNNNTNSFSTAALVKSIKNVPTLKMLFATPVNSVDLNTFKNTSFRPLYSTCKSLTNTGFCPPGHEEFPLPPMDLNTIKK